VWRIKNFDKMEDIMPTIKRSLTRPEKVDNLARAKKMRADGVDLQIREEWLESARSLNITVGGGLASMVFDLPGGGAAFAVWVRLVAQRPVIVLDCAMTTAWDNQIVFQAFFDERTPRWRLGQVDYPRSEVLNMRIMDSLSLDYGKMVEGMIFFTGLKPMPEAFHHGMTVPFTLVFLDQNEDEIRIEAELFVDRTWKRKPTNVSPKSGLYDPVEIPETREAIVSQDSPVPTAPDPVAKFRKNRVAGSKPNLNKKSFANRRKRQGNRTRNGIRRKQFCRGSISAGGRRLRPTARRTRFGSDH
jgi:hypothetical protein